MRFFYNKLICVFSLLTTLSMGCGHPTEENRSKIIVGNDDRVETRDTRVGALGYQNESEDVLYSCTTFAIGESTIMTAVHCLRESKDSDSSTLADINGLKARFNGIQYNVIEAKEILVGADTAILEISGKLDEYFSLGTYKQQGSDAKIISFSATSQKLFTTSGSINAHVVDLHKERLPGLILHKMDADHLSGASGSPIIQNDKVVAIHLGHIKDEAFLEVNEQESPVNYGVDINIIRDTNIDWQRNLFRKEAAGALWGTLKKVGTGIAKLIKECVGNDNCTDAVTTLANKVSSEEVTEYWRDYGLNPNATAEEKALCDRFLAAAKQNTNAGLGDLAFNPEDVTCENGYGEYKLIWNEDVRLGDLKDDMISNKQQACANRLPKSKRKSMSYSFWAEEMNKRINLRYKITTCDTEGVARGRLREGSSSSAKIYSTKLEDTLMGLEENSTLFYLDVFTQLDGVNPGNFNDYTIENVEVWSNHPLIKVPTPTSSYYTTESFVDELTNEQLPYFLAMAYIYSIYVDYFDRNPTTNDFVQILKTAVYNDLNEVELREFISSLRIREEYQSLFDEDIAEESLEKYAEELAQHPDMSFDKIKKLIATLRITEMYHDILNRPPTESELEKALLLFLDGNIDIAELKDHLMKINGDLGEDSITYGFSHSYDEWQEKIMSRIDSYDNKPMVCNFRPYIIYGKRGAPPWFTVSLPCLSCQEELYLTSYSSVAMECNIRKIVHDALNKDPSRIFRGLGAPYINCYNVGNLPEPSCGNGAHEAGELCDNGDENGQPNRCNETCTAINPPPCGDGFKDYGEECDDGPENGKPLKCNSSCSGITQAVCGNQILEDWEQCDEGPLNGQPNHCDHNCLAVTAPFCGNDVQEFNEQCDDGEENGKPNRCNRECTGPTQ